MLEVNESRMSVNWNGKRVQGKRAVTRRDVESNLHALNRRSVLRPIIKWRGTLRRSVIIIAVAVLCPGGLTCFAQQGKSIPEQIEWTWEVRPLNPNPKLPNVLLLGDSITRNYYPEVKKDLSGVANVYLMASSICVGDPRLPKEITEFARMEDVHFLVIHFNNGMHGWAYTEAQYKAGFPAFLRAVHRIAGKDSTLIWASTTPVRVDEPNGATNVRIERRNSIAAAFVRADGIKIDHQHGLMLKHQNLYENCDKGVVHFNRAGADIQGDQAAAMIRSALGVHKEK